MRMHAWGRRAKKLSTLALAPLILCAIAYGVMPATTARAATMQETLADDVFQNEPGSTGRCTIYAATNMLRRAALLNGDADWTSITTSSMSLVGRPALERLHRHAIRLLIRGGTEQHQRHRRGEDRAAHGDSRGEPCRNRALCGRLLKPACGPVAGMQGRYVLNAHDSLTGATSALDECVTRARVQRQLVLVRLVRRP